MAALVGGVLGGEEDVPLLRRDGLVGAADGALIGLGLLLEQDQLD